MPHATGIGRVELVLKERARAVEQRGRIGDAVAQRLHQSRRAAERVAQRAVHRGCRPSARASPPSRGPKRGGASGSAFSIGKSSNSRGGLHRRTDRQQRAAVLHEGLQLRPSRLADAVGPRPLRRIVALRIEPVDDPRSSTCRDGSRMTSYFCVEIAVEVLRLHDLVIDAVLLEQPHQPAAGHVAGGASTDRPSCPASSGSHRPPASDPRRVTTRPQLAGGLLDDGLRGRGGRE